MALSNLQLSKLWNLKTYSLILIILFFIHLEQLRMLILFKDCINAISILMQVEEVALMPVVGASF